MSKVNIHHKINQSHELSERLTPCSAKRPQAESSGLESCGQTRQLSARAAAAPCGHTKNDSVKPGEQQHSVNYHYTWHRGQRLPSGWGEGSAPWSQRRLCRSQQSESFVPADPHYCRVSCPLGWCPRSVGQRFIDNTLENGPVRTNMMRLCCEKLH